MKKVKVESVWRAGGRIVEAPFYFKRKVPLRGREQHIVRRCLGEARENLVLAQRKVWGWEMNWDLRNGLTLYVVLLEEILKGRTIRYRAIFEPAACMAAYLGHGLVLDLFARSGLPIDSFEWDTLDILLASILGRRRRMMRKLLRAYPALKGKQYEFYGNAGGFCAGFGSLGMLRDLRNLGFPMAACSRSWHQEPGDRRHFGSALLLAVQQKQRAMAGDLVAHGEFCPWKDLCFLGGSPRSFFKEAVRNGFFDIAKLYLDNGWLDVPTTDEAWWDIVERGGGCDDLRVFKFLETSFPQFNAKAIAREHADELSRSLCRYCGCVVRPSEGRWNCCGPLTLSEKIDRFSHLIREGRKDIVRYCLNDTPELLPVVWERWRADILAAFDEMPENEESCEPYLLRLAKQYRIELFPNEAARRFWTEPSPTRANAEDVGEDFPFDECLGDYYLPKEAHERYSKALHSTGREARRMMDDPLVHPNAYTRWNKPFSVHLANYADWPTFKGWLLRGMEIYHDNQDDPGCFGLEVGKGFVRHLLADLEHRPWESREYCGNSLRVAAATGDFVAVRELIRAVCPVNFGIEEKMERYTSPLHHALVRGHDRIARYLYVCGGMNVKDGVVYPVPDWIAKPRPLPKGEMRRLFGRDCRRLVWMTPTTPLPKALDHVREEGLYEAKNLDGHCLSLVAIARPYIAFRFEGKPFVITRESFSMDWDAYRCSYERIYGLLLDAGCEIL